MEETFQKIIANHFSDVAGLTASASVPVSESLANEVIALTLRGDRTIQSCLVSIHEQNQVAMRLKTSLWPWPLRLRLKLDKSVDFTSFSSPKMRMWLENSRLLGSLGSFFGALPSWAKLYGNQVVVDLSSFPRTPEERSLLELLKSVQVRTEEGRAIFEIQLEVDRTK